MHMHSYTYMQYCNPCMCSTHECTTKLKPACDPNIYPVLPLNNSTLYPDFPSHEMMQYFTPDTYVTQQGERGRKDSTTKESDFLSRILKPKKPNQIEDYQTNHLSVHPILTLFTKLQIHIIHETLKMPRLHTVTYK